MTFDEYQTFANRISALHEPWKMARMSDTLVLQGPPILGINNLARVDHGSAGLSSEAGEIAEHVKHVRFHGTALDREHLIK